MPLGHRAAAERDQHDVEVGAALEQLEADRPRAVAREEVQAVLDQVRAVAGGELAREHAGVLEVVAFEQDRRPERADALDLQARSPAARRRPSRGMLPPRSAVGQRLAEVPGAGADGGRRRPRVARART